MNRYGMIIDLNRCVGCQTCTIACKHANDTPPGVEWRRVLDVEYGSFPDVERLFLVTGCQHCANPSCVPVCPTGATRQREDGLVTMDYDMCIGCGSCALACPYQARTIVHEKIGYYGEQTLQEQRTSHDDRLGVANKCTFCIERIDTAKVTGLVPGVDPSVTPACAVSCISKAIRFGDFADAASEVSELARDNRSFQMHAELGNDPQIKYLYEIPKTVPGREPDAGDADDERQSDTANSLVGKRQVFWDYRAAMNFILGGMSSGLVVLAWLANVGGVLGAQSLPWVYLAAALSMATGLTFVFMEIGRKMRFLRVILRPQSSWMTRETWCVAVLYPLVAASFLYPGPAVYALAALAALCFLGCQARILYACKGIPTWRAPLIPWMLAATGLFEGMGLLVIVLFFAGVPVTSVMALGGLVLALANAALWRRYLGTAKARGIGPLSRLDLAEITPTLHLVGHAVPAILFALRLALGPGIGGELVAIAGLATLAGGVMWKFTVITRACHQQGSALPVLPQRGSGKRAAPERLVMAEG